MRIYLVKELETKTKHRLSTLAMAELARSYDIVEEEFDSIISLPPNNFIIIGGLAITREK